MDIRDIMKEIERLEQCDTTYQNCTKLAVLYCIRDHNVTDTKKAEYPYPPSEFTQAFINAPADKALAVLDEHMDAIRLLHGKEYSAIIQRLRSMSLGE